MWCPTSLGPWSLTGTQCLCAAYSLHGGEQEENEKEVQLVVIVSKAPPEKINTLEWLGEGKRFGQGSNSVHLVRLMGHLPLVAHCVQLCTFALSVLTK